MRSYSQREELVRVAGRDLLMSKSTVYLWHGQRTRDSTVACQVHDLTVRHLPGWPSDLVDVLTPPLLQVAEELDEVLTLVWQE